MERLGKKAILRITHRSKFDTPAIHLEDGPIIISGPLWKWDWVSKLRDGLLPAFVMLLLILVPSLLILPIQNHYSRPGLLVYMLILLAGGVVTLERSLPENRPMVRRAWYGLSGGMLTWMALEVTDRLGSAGLTSLNAVPFILILGLISTILWRRVFPLPVRWFMLVFFLNWISRFLISGEEFLAGYFSQVEVAYWITAGLGGLGILIFLASIIWRSRERIQRMRMAIGLWFSTLVVLEVLLAILL